MKLSVKNVIIICMLVAGCSSCISHMSPEDDYIVAAYVWPSCHNDSMAEEKLWSEGDGEWEIIRKGTPRFEGHYQPRVPLWGYESDDDSEAWKKKIDAATGHGVNTFIFDWYWYNGHPFLEGAVNAFLQAPNADTMNFYLMWANHDVPGNMWNHYRYKTDSLIWHGTVDWDNFRIVVERVIRQYFKQPNYFKIEGQPVFSVYHTANLIKSFGGLYGAGKALDYFRSEVVKAGFPGLHLQLIGGGTTGYPGFWGDQYDDVGQVIKVLKANSVTLYNMAGSNSRREDYITYGIEAMELREKWDAMIDIPFFPCVSVGWDDTPRYPQKGKKEVIHLNNTPESFSAFLFKAKEYADKHTQQPKLIVINAWNEWVEGSYLEPDMNYGYGYLEAVKEVMINGKYKK